MKVMLESKTYEELKTTIKPVVNLWVGEDADSSDALHVDLYNEIEQWLNKNRIYFETEE